MASLKDVKNKISAVKKTKQITKAMNAYGEEFKDTIK